MVVAILMYNDRVWLTTNGLYLCGSFYPRARIERLAWTDDGRAFTLRTSGWWPFQALDRRADPRRLAPGRGGRLAAGNALGDYLACYFVNGIATEEISGIQDYRRGFT